jgi:Cation transport ATPase
MKYNYKLENLDCANCAAKMEEAVRKIDGVISSKVVFMTARLTIESEASDIEIIEEKADKAIRKIESNVRMKRV